MAAKNAVTPKEYVKEFIELLEIEIDECDLVSIDGSQVLLAVTQNISMDEKIDSLHRSNRLT